MPGYGIEAGQNGLLPWEWAKERLEKAHNSKGTPHLAVVWGVWVEDCFYFSTGRESQKAKHLAARKECSVAPEGGAESIVVRGAAEPAKQPKAATKAYKAKYGSGFPDPLWQVKPRKVIAVVEAQFTTAATKWTFDED
ncbi:MAG TPA: hypothetical protein DGT23_12355 [Micromonosporaceae bacterium]|nr:hypothetical protein [Micromonosporaceae bacterium]